MDTDQALLDGEVDAEASTEPEEQQAEADPMAAVVARLDAAEAEVARLKMLDPGKIGPAIGRVAALQSQLDAIKDRNPSADLDPRISANETLTVTLAQALANSDLVDERFKQTLNTALAGIEQANSKRERDQLKASLKAEIATEFAQPQEDSDSYDPWKDATLAVLEAATEAGVTLTDADFERFQSQSGGSPSRAVRIAERWIQENKTDPATKRVAERQRAAGNGSPKPGGGLSVSSIDDAYDAYNSGQITGKQLDDYRTKFGVSPF